MKKFIERIKIVCWIIIYYPIYGYRVWKTRKIRNKLMIYSSIETVENIVNNKLSVCRYGDGEFQMMSHYLNSGNESNFYVNTFQKYNKDLAYRLIDVFKQNDSKLLICIPYALKDTSVCDIYGGLFWKRDWLYRYNMFVNLGALNKNFGDSTFTRFYLGRKDIKDYNKYVALLKDIWKDRDVIIVEGSKSRLGVGNDLFSSTKSIKRVICPPTNAFEKYDQIINATIDVCNKESLILIALGHTATVMAYDFYKSGYQAIDLGHVDIEYEWYLLKAKSKVAVKNKYVNEVESGRIVSDCTDKKYLEEIVATIL